MAIKKILSNFTVMSASEILFQGSRIISVIYIARILGAAGFGAINFAIAIISYFLIVTNLGLGELGVREVSRKKDFNYIAETIISMRTSIAFVSFLMILPGAFFFINDAKTAALIVVFSLMLFPYAMSTEWIFRGTEKMKYNANGKVLNALFYLGMILWLVKSPSDALKVAFISVSAEFITCVYCYAVYRKKFGPITIHFNFKEWKKLLPVSTQLFLSSALLIFYNNFGTLILGILKDVYSVGIYGAAYKLVSLSYAMSYIIVIVTFPAISRLFHESPEEFKSLIKHCAKGTILLGLPMGVIGVMLGSRIIDLLYGPAYHNAGPLFQIMSLFLAVNSTSYTLSYSLIACDKQDMYLRIVWWAAIFNIAFNIVGVPIIGYYASACAIVITECVVLVMSITAMRRFADLAIMPLIKKPVFASLVMGIIIMILARLNIFILIPFSLLIYIITIFFVGGLSKHEILRLRETFA